MSNREPEIIDLLKQIRDLLAQGSKGSRPARVGSSSASLDPVWLSPEDVVSRVPGMTLDKLEDLRKRRAPPTYYKPTLRTVVYLVTEVDAWVAASRVTTIGDVR
ncbi:hypothetical protein Q9S78_11965 [Microbacterium sp. KSW-18]|uniref:DNA-binding protein n=1 Tax=Microbacterium aquilitoris TaxID=3067307 RepID=A0ABU3GLP1_9MICO|nr:hypothetical protein [Microbacterium sp. KSW-18]MDT3331384.1 hypothetical protein [Microbacterium sp. KSW-18]